MPYSQENYDEAFRLREHGTDDASIRMILVSKKLTSTDIDELFLALDAALPAKKNKSFENKSTKDIEYQDFSIWMIALTVIGLILAVVGASMSINILWYLGVIGFVLGLWALSRAFRDDRRAERKRRRDEEW